MGEGEREGWRVTEKGRGGECGGSDGKGGGVREGGEREVVGE